MELAVIISASNFIPILIIHYIIISLTPIIFYFTVCSRRFFFHSLRIDAVIYFSQFDIFSESCLFIYVYNIILIFRTVSLFPTNFEFLHHLSNMLIYSS